MHAIGILPGRHALGWLALLSILLVGIVTRVVYIDEQGLAHDRQFRSYLIARSVYFDQLAEIPEWRTQVAATSRARQESLEPPITEYVVALIYRVVGTESFPLARAVTSFFWLCGACLLFALVLRLGSLGAALISTAYFLFAPTAFWVSLSVLPESLMIATMIASLLAMVCYFEARTNFRFWIAALITALALVVKPLTVFVLFSVFAALSIRQRETWRGIISPSLIAFCALSALPAAVYYGRGLFVEDYLQWKVETSFLPHLLLSVTFWDDLLSTIIQAVGRAPLLLAILATITVPSTRVRTILLGAGLGYAAFCVLFNYFTQFVVYYHSQLLVIVAIALGPFLAEMIRRLFATRKDAFARTLMGGVVLLVAAMTVQQIRGGRTSLSFEGVETAEAVGRIVGHSNRVAYVAPVYGLPLEYYGELAGEAWPRATRGWPLVTGPEVPATVEDRLATLGFVPEYFVITNMPLFRRYHDDLRIYLEENASLIAEEENYLVYSMLDSSSI